MSIRNNVLEPSASPTFNRELVLAQHGFFMRQTYIWFVLIILFLCLLMLQFLLKFYNNSRNIDLYEPIYVVGHQNYIAKILDNQLTRKAQPGQEIFANAKEKEKGKDAQNAQDVAQDMDADDLDIDVVFMSVLPKYKEIKAKLQMIYNPTLNNVNNDDNANVNQKMQSAVSKQKGHQEHVLLTTNSVINPQITLPTDGKSHEKVLSIRGASHNLLYPFDSYIGLIEISGIHHSHNKRLHINLNTFQNALNAQDVQVYAQHKVPNDKQNAAANQQYNDGVIDQIADNRATTGVELYFKIMHKIPVKVLIAFSLILMIIIAFQHIEYGIFSIRKMKVRAKLYLGWVYYGASLLTVTVSYFMRNFLPYMPKKYCYADYIIYSCCLLTPITILLIKLLVSIRQKFAK